MSKKTRISADKLYRFMQEHNFTAYVLSDYMGVSESIVRGCFRHDLNRHGHPLQFSQENIQKMNDALPRMAADLRRCVITFGSGETITNRCGAVYDLSVAQQVKDGMARFFNIRAMTNRLLGWNAMKCGARLSSEAHITYSHVSREDCDRLNEELLSVVGVLSGVEVESID